MLNYYQVVDREKVTQDRSWWSWIRKPYVMICGKAVRTQEYLKRQLSIRDIAYSILDSAVEAGKKVFDDILSAIKKMAVLAAFAALALSILGFFLFWKRSGKTEAKSEGFGGSASLETKTKKKNAIRIEAEPEVEGDPSGSLETKARKKNRVRIEDDSIQEGDPSGSLETKAKRRNKVRIESSLVKISCPFRLDGGDSLKFVETSEADADVVVTVNKQQKEATVEFVDGKVINIPKVGVHVPKLKLINVIKDWKSKQQPPEAESKEDRLALVDEILQEGPKAQAARDPQAMKVMEIIHGNLAIVRNVKYNVRLRGVFICDTLLMVPGHITAAKPLDELVLEIKTNTSPAWTVQVKDLKSYQDPEKDLLFVQLPNTTTKAYRSVVSKFVTAEDVDWKSDQAYLVTPKAKTEDKTVTRFVAKQLRSLTYKGRQSYEGDDNKMIEILTGFDYLGDTEQGECGSIVVKVDPQSNRKILGIHVAGAPGYGIGSFVTEDYLKTVLSKFSLRQSEQLEVAYNREVVEQFFDCEYHEEDTDDGEKEIWYDCDTNMEIVMTPIPEHCPARMTLTSLMKSPIHGKVVETLSAPAHLGRYLNSDGVLVDPYKRALGKLEKPQIVLPQEVVDLVAAKMTLEYAQLEVDQLQLGANCGLLSNFEIINGITGSDYIRRMDMHTSPGYPYVLAGGKSTWLEQVDEVNWEMGDVLLSRVKHREELALQGLTCPAIMVDTLKDERLPLASVEIGKTRVFSNCPFDFNVLMRKYFLKFLAHLMSHHVDSEVSVGLNVHGEEWAALYKRLKMKGSHWIAGDYGAWDKRTPLQIALALLPLVESFYRRFPDYRPEHAVLRATLIRQAFTSERMVLGMGGAIIYRVHQSMPSGIPLTAVYNSLINSALFRVVYALLAHEQGWSYSKAVNSYSKHVSFAAFGDDHICRVSDVVFPWFNMQTISRKMEEFGIEYTMPDKSTDIAVELEEKKLQYLKRKFVSYDGRIDAPMELEKVLDILNWVKAKTPLEAKEALKQAVKSVMLELTHHPEETYNRWSARIFEECVKSGVDVPLILYKDALAERLKLEVDLTLADVD